MLANALAPGQAAAYRRQLLRASPVALLVPVVIAIALVAAGAELRPIAVAVGAAGWALAFLARGPVAVLLRARGDRDLASPWFVAASGPAEELVRLGAVLVLGRDLDTALSIGLGWAAIEVVFAVIQGIALATLMDRDDAEARRIRAAIPAPPAALLAPSAPWWGVVERIWASVLHLAFTAILAAAPGLVLATIPAHSATNLALGRATERWPLGWVQLAGCAWAGALGLVAWWLW
jgi:hypothetical protein